MTMAQDWDIAADLAFLLPAVDDVDADLLAVCDMITAEHGQRGNKAETATTKRKRPSQAKIHQQTIAGIKSKIRELEDQLQEVKNAKALSTCGGKWILIDRNLQLEAHRALQEKQELQYSIAFNRSYINRLVALVRKRPRVQEALVKDWHLFKLPVDPTQRRAAIHAIAEQQRDRKQSQFIISGLINQSQNVLRVRPVLYSRAVKYEVVNYATLPAPHYIVSRALWRVFSSPWKRTIQRSSSTEAILERLDAHTVYERFAETQDGVTSYSCNVRKLFINEPEHLIVYQSVLDDETIPHMSSGAVENESVWISIEPLDDFNCRVKHLVNLIFDADVFPTGKGDTSIEAITKSLGRVKFEQAIPHQDLFVMPRSEIPHALDKFPGFAAIVARRIQFKATLRKAICDAISVFNKTRARRPSSKSREI
ncbi:unnamed protein product [Aphanomyces euteiches]|uniref:Uncharacterized protein n=1 Tax=Aphanomyces euteiches TaxID=100861 RepID=A0A6G0X7N9_9STRA|nr:hypothetical protein Ae201684_007621 [Aphanomyces euteiches]